VVEEQLGPDLLPRLGGRAERKARWGEHRHLSIQRLQQHRVREPALQRVERGRAARRDEEAGGRGGKEAHDAVGALLGEERQLQPRELDLQRPRGVSGGDAQRAGAGLACWLTSSVR
jgi:hypothetical protein